MAPPGGYADNTSEKWRSSVIKIWAFFALGCANHQPRSFALLMLNRRKGISGVGQWESVPGHCVSVSVLLATQCVVGIYLDLLLELGLKLRNRKSWRATQCA